MKTTIAACVIAAGLIATPTPAHAAVNPYLNNATPTAAEPLFNPWTGAINPQTVTNQTAIPIASGYGRTICYGSRVDATWTYIATASMVASAWQTAGPSCSSPVISEYVSVSTVTVFNDAILPDCTATSVSATVAQVWVVKENCGRFTTGANPPWDAIPRRGNWRQFTCVNTVFGGWCHSPVNHWVY